MSSISRRAAPRLPSSMALCLVLTALGAAPRLGAEESSADPDLLVQGEYIGSLERDGEAELWGMQVVALGQGRFDAVAYGGGLPGAGWDRKSRLRFSGQRGDDRVSLSEKDAKEPRRILIPARVRELKDAAGQVTGRLEIKDPAHLVVRSPDSRTIGRLERVVRKSPSLGEKPPPGAMVLFDGSSAEQFRTAKGDTATLSAEGFLQVRRGSGGLFSRKPQASGRLHLEFRLPFEPAHRGQGRANSGCYLQGRYEVQILDSFGLEGKENECGGVYSSGKDPAENMALPPLSWQTFDIEFDAAAWDAAGTKTANARLSVWHNGVPIYRDLEIDHATTAAPSKEGPEPLPLYLQDHGHDVVFRNLWWVER